MDELQSNIVSIVPISVMAAVALFFVKETVEFFKRKRERERKISAYKTLISEELRKNAWTIGELREMCADVGRESFKSISYSKNSSGTEKITFTHQEGGNYSVLWPVHTSVFDKVVVDLAAIDEDLFKSAKATYEYLAEVRHIRQQFINFSEDESIKHFVKGLSDYGQKILDNSEAALRKLFKECTGTELSEHKLRSYI